MKVPAGFSQSGGRNNHGKRRLAHVGNAPKMTAHSDAQAERWDTLRIRKHHLRPCLLCGNYQNVLLHPVKCHSPISSLPPILPCCLPRVRCRPARPWFRSAQPGFRLRGSGFRLRSLVSVRAALVSIRAALVSIRAALVSIRAALVSIRAALIQRIVPAFGCRLRSAGLTPGWGTPAAAMASANFPKKRAPHFKRLRSPPFRWRSQ
jgi:hypothetical protein